MTHSLHVNVGPAVLPDYMSGTLVCCALAWPKMSEARTFHRVAQEMEVAHLRQILRHDADALFRYRALWPQQDWDRQEHLAKVKRRMFPGTLQKRLDQRAAAGRMGIALAHEQLFGIAAELPPGVTRMSVDQISRLVQSDTAYAHSEDVEKHVWRPSLPIIHLAMATQLMLAGPFRDLTSVDCAIENSMFFKAIVQLASVIEPMVAAHDKFRITRAEQTRIRWLS